MCRKIHMAFIMCIYTTRYPAVDLRDVQHLPRLDMALGVEKRPLRW